MMRGFVCWLMVVLSLSVLVGCRRGGTPEPLSPEEEQQFQQQLEDAQRAEGAAQSDSP